MNGDPQAVPAGSLVIWGVGPGWGQPSVSPFVVKTLTWLRMAGVPHELRVLRRPPRSRTKKVPYLELDAGKYIEGSDQIIRYATEHVGASLDARLSREESALALAMRRMLEENLYYLGAWSRWLTNDGFRSLRPVYFSQVPAPLRGLVAHSLRRRMRRNLHGQGIGRLPTAEIQTRAQEDIRALATLLGDRDYFFGEPSSIDAVAYAMLSASRNVPYHCVVSEALEQADNLLRYLERIRTRHWAHA